MITWWLSFEGYWEYRETIKLKVSPLGKQLSRNALAKFASELVGRVAWFALLVLAARQLSETDLGLFNYGLAVGFVVAQVVSFGLPIIMTRDIAVQGRAAQTTVLTTLRLHIILVVPVSLSLVLLLLTSNIRTYFNLLALATIPLLQVFIESLAHIFRGQNRLLAEAWLLSAMRLVTAVGGGVVLWLGGGLAGLTLAYLLAVSLVLLAALQQLKREGWLPPWLRLFRLQETNLVTYRSRLREAAPIGLAIFLSIAYTRSAILLLQVRLGATAVAQYSVARQLVEPSQLIPASIMAAAFPTFAQTIQQEPKCAYRLGSIVTVTLAATGLVAALVAWQVGDWLIPWLYGATFTPAIPIFKWLSVSIVAAFINYSLTHYLIARQQQRYLTLFTAVMLLQHVIISWGLIPYWGAVAPAISIILAEVTLLLCCLTVLRFSR